MDAPLVYLEEGFTSSLYEQSLDDQIQNLKNDGVRFTIINEARAKEYLSQRINLFKLKRFAINYRQIDGRYEGLDFAYLVDLASIDYQIRLFCGYIAGRVEHDLKLRFNHLLMIDAAHDGFDIARLIDRDAEFVFNDDSDYQNKKKRLSYSPYTDSYIRHYLPDPEIWDLWEIFDLSSLFKAYEIYLGSIHQKDRLTKFFGSIRRLRNAAAHNTCLLIGTPRRTAPPTEQLYSCLRTLFKNQIPQPVGSVTQKSQLAYDFASLLVAFLSASQSGDSQQHAAEAATQLSKRIRRNIKFYVPKTYCPELTALLVTISHLCDGFANYLQESSRPKSGTLYYEPRKE